MASFGIFPLLIGPVFLLIGIIFRAFPPKSINAIYGYRTSFSMKNPDTWNEANSYSANLSVIAGIIQLIVGILCLLLPEPGKAGVYAGLPLMLGSMFMMIFKTERHLKRIFDANGNRKV